MTSYVQVITQWNPQESTLTFDISKFKNYYSNVKKIEIASILFCEDDTHHHFETTKKTSAYPTQENYQEKITITVPKPQVLEHRRKTIYFLPKLQLDSELNSGNSEFENYQRIKRNTEEKIINKRSKRIKRNTISPNELLISIEFTKPLIKSTIVDPQSIFIDSLIFRIESHFQKANEKFNNLLLGKFSIIQNDNESDDSKASVTITLPAKTTLYVECPQFFNAIVFEDHVTNIAEKKFGFKNETNFQKEILGNPINIASLSLLYVTYQEKIGIGDSLIFPPNNLSFFLHKINIFKILLNIRWT